MTKLYPESCDSFEVPITVTLYGPVCGLVTCGLMDISQILDETATSVFRGEGVTAV